jgi:hypothetical protein
MRSKKEVVNSDSQGGPCVLKKSSGIYISSTIAR